MGRYGSDAEDEITDCYVPESWDLMGLSRVTLEPTTEFEFNF